MLVVKKISELSVVKTNIVLFYCLFPKIMTYKIGSLTKKKKESCLQIFSSYS